MSAYDVCTSTNLYTPLTRIPHIWKIEHRITSLECRHILAAETTIAHELVILQSWCLVIVTFLRHINPIITAIARASKGIEQFTVGVEDHLVCNTQAPHTYTLSVGFCTAQACVTHSFSVHHRFYSSAHKYRDIARVSQSLEMVIGCDWDPILFIWPTCFGQLVLGLYNRKHCIVGLTIISINQIEADRSWHNYVIS